MGAQEIADIYKRRWQVELFFKWIKQNLKIKSFWGTSENAVFSQIWVALIISVLLWMCKTLDGIIASTHQILQMITTFWASQPADIIYRLFNRIRLVGNFFRSVCRAIQDFPFLILKQYRTG
jgi:hypothetical protein